jgi:hypothetical protein
MALVAGARPVADWAAFDAGPPSDPCCERRADRPGPEEAAVVRGDVGPTARDGIAPPQATEKAKEFLTAAGRQRGRGPALSRAVGWQAEALRAEATGDRRRLFHACRRGLDVIDEHRGALGSSELRALASSHGTELAALGQRHALRQGRPRLLLAWSERWRANALAVPAVRPADDERLQADLVALREVTVQLAVAQARARSAATGTLRREQLRLEQAVRARALRARGPGPSNAAPEGFDVAGLLDELGDDRLIEFVDVDGELQLLVCGGGRVRRYAVGLSARASREVDFARFGLTLLAHGLAGPTPSRPGEAAPRRNAAGERAARSGRPASRRRRGGDGAAGPAAPSHGHCCRASPSGR